MKNLIYSPALLCVILLIASCRKNEAIQPRNGLNKTDSVSSVGQPTQRNCDSAQIIHYVLSNSTGINSFVITFSGPQDYTFSFPAKGSKTVALKSGTYYVQIPPTGDYSAHSFSLRGRPYVKAPGARYENVKVNPCSVELQAEIN
ncbi:hypothetical protein [Mucilaginibacter lappiensis]|jgi:hypothetical protein|uniref:hypothetical protein n=1 Tax=Mucilaginibacter lappiensis TaxID=354630 RepID=UPI003D1E65FE